MSPKVPAPKQAADDGGSELMKFKALEPIQTIEQLLDEWERMATRLRNTVQKHVAEKDFGAALENTWLASGIEWCRKELKELMSNGKAPVDVRLTEDEKRTLTEKAGGEGVETYIRRCLGLPEIK